MIVVETTTEVRYACYLNEEDSQKVKKYAEENKCSLTEAVNKLYHNFTIDLYLNSTEIDFSTESIDIAEEED